MPLSRNTRRDPPVAPSSPEPEPAVPAPELARPLHTQVPDAALTLGWGPRVLVVDDDELCRLAASSLLESLGLSVDVAGDGLAAVEMSANWPYVAIFMDCAMPGMDGYTAAREIARREGWQRNTPVIAMTVHPMSRCIAAGMSFHMAKPLAIDTLRLDCIRLGLLPRTDSRADRPVENVALDTPLLKPPAVRPAANHAAVTDTDTSVLNFVKQATLRLPELYRRVNAGDCAALGRIATELKDTAAHLGATRIADLSDRLGKAARDPDTVAAVAIEPQLRRALLDTATEVRRRLDDASSTDSLMDATPVALAPGSVPEDQDPGPAGPVRVAIADDDPLARDAIEIMLTQAEGLAFIGSAASVEEIVELADVKRPDVVVLDWMMPEGGGPEAARRILQTNPDIRVVGLSSFDTADARDDMIDAGACGLLVKGGSADDLAEMIRQAAAPSISPDAPAPQANVNQLTSFTALDDGQSPVDLNNPEAEIHKSEPDRFWADSQPDC
jgi:CheY-like chemotaxis protein